MAAHGGQTEPIQVSIRIRPVPKTPATRQLRSDHSQPVWEWDDKRLLCTAEDSDRGSEFTFQRVFGPEVQTPEVYEVLARPIVQRTFEGFNGCIFAYGQTNSGKTYTITGEQLPGIIPLAVIDFFKLIRETEGRLNVLRVSYLEVYNEQLKDLLTNEQVNLSIQDHPERGVVVVNLTEVIVNSLDQVLRLLAEGDDRRMMGKNDAHAHASRSHTIFQLILESRDVSDGNVRISTLNLVDLAGSESHVSAFDTVAEDAVESYRAAQTIGGRMAAQKRTANNQKEREGKNIRQSLLSLVRVVNMLGSKAKDSHIPYRDSKITRILRTALGGNANTSIVCTINPAENKESVSTLRFGATAQRISNRPKIVNIMSQDGLLNRYQNDLQELRRQMDDQQAEKDEAIKSVEIEKEKLAGEMAQAHEEQRRMLAEQYQQRLRDEKNLREEAERINTDMRRQLGNMHKLILTAPSTELPREPAKSSTPPPHGPAPGYRPRRHSFPGSGSGSGARRATTSPQGSSNRISVEEVRRAVQRSADPKASSAEVAQLKAQLEELEERRSCEVEDLNNIIDSYEFKIQREEDKRDEFFRHFYDEFEKLDVVPSLKRILNTLLRNVKTIRPDDTPVVDGLIDETKRWSESHGLNSVQADPYHTSPVRSEEAEAKLPQPQQAHVTFNNNETILMIDDTVEESPASHRASGPAISAHEHKATRMVAPLRGAGWSAPMRQPSPASLCTSAPPAPATSDSPVVISPASLSFKPTPMAGGTLDEGGNVAGNVVQPLLQPTGPPPLAHTSVAPPSGAAAPAPIYPNGLPHNQGGGSGSSTAHQHRVNSTQGSFAGSSGGSKSKVMASSGSSQQIFGNTTTTTTTYATTGLGTSGMGWVMGGEEAKPLDTAVPAFSTTAGGFGGFTAAELEAAGIPTQGAGLDLSAGSKLSYVVGPTGTLVEPSAAAGYHRISSSSPMRSVGGTFSGSGFGHRTRRDPSPVPQMGALRYSSPAPGVRVLA